jgi:hypothetical protein
MFKIENDVGGTCSIHGGGEFHIHVLVGKTEEMRPLAGHRLG